VVPLDGLVAREADQIVESVTRRFAIGIKLRH
jgi:hypothetical protein